MFFSTQTCLNKYQVSYLKIVAYLNSHSFFKKKASQYKVFLMFTIINYCDKASALQNVQNAYHFKSK